MNVPAVEAKDATDATDATDANAPLVATFDAALVERNLVELFDAEVRRAPDAIAVIGSDRTVTYGELAARSVRVCDCLRARRLRAEQPVGVYMARTTDVIAVLIGILRAGGAYVPLDPAEPVEWARTLMDRAGLTIVLGDAALLTSLRAAMDTASRSDRNDRNPDLVDVAPIVEATSTSDTTIPDAAPPCAPGGARLAYILFTSGSTGAPKGVEVEHRNVINLLLCAQEAFVFSAQDRYLAVSTLSFDISVVEVFLPISGASLVLADKQLLLDRGATAAAIVRHGVTVFQTGPSIWSLLLEGVADFPWLRVAITTGEAIAPALARRLASVAAIVWNLYGPTETTIWCSGYRIDPPDALEASTSVAAPLGHMWPNMPAIVVDADGNAVPDDVEGELWVCGLAVSRGYQADPVRTQERYIVRDDGGRYYRTGDIVSRRADGVLRFFGRNDDQIQIHGVRTEPMEVESAVRADARVRHAATTWFVTPSGAKAIVAGVVVAEAGSSAAALRERLAARLPSAMVPARFGFYEGSLPLTANGKMDRLAIRADATRVGVDDCIASRAHEEDMTPTQRTLRDIWRLTLPAAAIGLQDSFFALGGDSLAAVAMVLDAEDAFGVSMSVTAVLESPTLAGMAALIDQARTAKIPVGSNDPAFTFQLVRDGHDAPVFFCSIELNLARRGVWQPDCPLYAVNYWMLGNGFSRAKTLPELARTHVAEIRSIQPHGPYRIAGFSFGGIVAVEIANQLQRCGEAIELLFLLDPTEPYRTQANPGVLRVDKVEAATAAARRHRERLRRRLMRHVRSLAHQAAHDHRHVVPYLKQKAKLAPAALLADRKFWPWLHYRRVHLHGRHPNAFTARLLPEDRWIAFWYVAQRLARTYVVNPYEGDSLAVFIDRDERFAAWEPLLGRRGDIRIVGASHGALVAEPALSEWMAILTERLRSEAG